MRALCREEPALGQPVQRRLNLRHLTGPGGRLGQFGYDQVAERLGGKQQMGPERVPTGLVAGYFTDPRANLTGVAGPA